MNGKQLAYTAGVALAVYLALEAVRGRDPRAARRPMRSVA